MMLQAIKYSLIAIITSAILTGCNNNNVTLQRYFVAHQETKNFVAQDLPLSVFNIDEKQLTAEQRAAYKSVKRLNFLGYKMDSTNVETFYSELKKVSVILKDEKYKDLMDFNYQGVKIALKYVGDKNETDEFIILSSSKDMGFGVVRVLGKGMSPEKIMTLGQLFQNSHVDTSQIKSILPFF